MEKEDKILSFDASQLLEKWKKKQEKVKREDWIDYFILKAYRISTRSLDPQTQCGAIIITPEKDIVATGYNSFVRDIDDSVLPNLRPEKYDWMLHAEHNAILSCARRGVSCNKCYAYITGPPCIYCTQYMYQVGIKKIFYTELNPANMCQGKEAKIKWEILAYLLNKKIEFYPIFPGEKLKRKILEIKSCRTLD
tara:strand:+ start:22 stop:603 length:582 start_codon:yes stop_codon:yes gene_type:complete